MATPMTTTAAQKSTRKSFSESMSTMSMLLVLVVVCMMVMLHMHLFVMVLVVRLGQMDSDVYAADKRRYATGEIMSGSTMRQSNLHLLFFAAECRLS